MPSPRSPHPSSQSARRPYLRFERRQRLQRWLNQYGRLSLVSLMLAVFLGIILVALLPGMHRFEARLVATQLSFITHEPDALFLNRIRRVQEISIRGQQTAPLILTGQFLDPDLQGINELEIELPHDFSQLAFRPIDSTEESLNELEVTEVQLQDQTTVTQLSYAPATQRLEFNYELTETSRPESPTMMRLYLGTQPLSITLEGYRLPALGLEDPSGDRPRTITFQPDIAEYQQVLPVRGGVSILLPPASTDANSPNWFWGNLQVQAVQFSERQETGLSFDEERVLSTLQTGKIRLADQELDVEPAQFLMLEGSGIQQIRHIQVLETEGLEIRAMGEASQIQVGLDPNFPIEGIRSNALTQWLTPEQMIAVVSFSGAMVASLLAWLVDNLFPSSEDN